MKTLQECKDEIAVKYGYEDYDTLASICVMNDLDYDKYSDEAAEIYASQFKPSEDHLKDLGEVFENKSDCYADSDSVVMAMTKEKFIEIVSQRDRMIWEKACEAIRRISEDNSSIKSFFEENINPDFKID